MLFQRTDCLHQSALKIVTDTHDLTGGFHLGSQGSLCRDKFIKWQAGDFHHAIIQRRLKTGIGFLCDCVFNLVQGIAQSDFCRHLCDGVAGSLTCQCGRTAHAGIYLDDAIFKAGRMQRKLHITSAGNLQLVDNL